MKTFISIMTGAAVLAVALLVQSCSTRAKAGPNGGDVVALHGSKTNAEVLANSDTGEVMVHTWDEDLKAPQPIEAKPLTLGAEDKQVQLEPHPLTTDPPGYCSRFYGRADWVRGGGVHHGWLSHSAAQNARQYFEWSRCWNAGRAHGRMWSEMGGHGGMRHE